MKTYYEYKMTIEDNEFNETYDFTAYFEDHMVADRFLTENENVGNVIIINSVAEVKMKPQDLPMC